MTSSLPVLALSPAVSVVWSHPYCPSESCTSPARIVFLPNELNHQSNQMTFSMHSIIDTCPHNDLSDLPIDIMLNSFEGGYNLSASDQCSVLSDGTGSQCTSFNFDTYATKWYNPGQLPSGFPGTASLSETTAGGSLTSAPEPYTFSLFPAYTSVITPAPYNAKAVTATNTGTAVETATGTATTGKGSASSATPSKGAARSLASPISFNFGVWSQAVYMIASAFSLGLALVL
jgi:hypothetical protein